MTQPGSASAPTGLNAKSELASNGAKAVKKRNAAPDRSGTEWQCVTVVTEDDKNPSVQCKFCNKKFCGGATRIRSHVLGTGGIEACSGESE
eukprot:4147792-Prymnesium_polylepis.1